MRSKSNASVLLVPLSLSNDRTRAAAAARAASSRFQRPQKQSSPSARALRQPKLLRSKQCRPRKPGEASESATVFAEQSREIQQFGSQVSSGNEMCFNAQSTMLLARIRSALRLTLLYCN